MIKVYDPEAIGLKITRMIRNEALCYCPYHSDSNPSAEYNVIKGVFHCFTCKASKTSKQLVEDLGGSLVEVPRESVLDQREKLGIDTEWISNLLKNPLALGDEYMRSRGVSDKLIEKYKIRKTPAGIAFPILNRFGSLVGVQLRQTKAKPKYMFYGQREPIWPWSNFAKPQNLVITEGVFGVLNAQSAKIPAISIMGSGQIDRVIRILNTNGMVKPYVFLDDDYAGLLAAGKFILNGIPAIVRAEPADEIDPKDFRRIYDHLGFYSTLDVMEVVDRSSQPFKLQSALEKYYKGLS